MSDEKVFSIDEVLAAKSGTRFAVVKNVHGGNVRIASVSSADMIEWIEDNEVPAKKRLAGLRLMVKSLINENGTRLPADQYEAAVEAFAQKDAKDNGTIVEACLELNGLKRKPFPNASSEAGTAGSPTASPSPQAV